MDCFVNLNWLGSFALVGISVCCAFSIYALAKYNK